MPVAPDGILLDFASQVESMLSQLASVQSFLSAGDADEAGDRIYLFSQDSGAETSWITVSPNGRFRWERQTIGAAGLNSNIQQQGVFVELHRETARSQDALVTFLNDVSAVIKEITEKAGDSVAGYPRISSLGSGDNLEWGQIPTYARSEGSAEGYYCPLELGKEPLR